MMVLLRSIVCLSLMLSFFHELTAQNYSRLGTQDGLMNESVYACFLDDYHRIWVSTEGGVYRFNGDFFERIETQDPVINSGTFGFFLDSRKRLWFRTSRFNLAYYAHDSLHALHDYNDSAYDYISSIAEAADGKLYFTTYGRGLLSYHQNQLSSYSCNCHDSDTKLSYTWVNAFNDVFVLGKQTIYSVKNGEMIPLKKIPQASGVWRSFQSGNDIYFANKSSLFVYRSVLNQLEPIELEYLNGEIIDIQKIEGQLWFATSNGVYIYDLKDNRCSFQKRLFPGIFTNHIMLDHEDGVWISSLEQGLFHLSPFEYQGVKQGIDDLFHPVYSLLSDKSSLLFGERGNHLAKLQGGKVDYIYSDLSSDLELDSGQKLQKISKDLQGNVHLIFDGYTVVLNSKYQLINRLAISSRASILTRSGKWLLGTAFGLILIDKKDITYSEIEFYKRVPHKKLLQSDIQDIVQRSDGAILVATQSGVFKLDSSLRQKEEIKELKGISVPHILRISDKTIYATEGKGIFFQDGDTGFFVNQSYGLSSNYIFCSTPISHNQYVIATSNGLNVLSWDGKKKQIQISKPSSGFPFTQVNGIAIHQDTCWVASNHGLIPVTLSELLKPTDNYYYPLLIQNIRVNGVQKEDWPYKDICLDFDENNVSFSYRAISYNLKRHVQYQLRLIGLDSNWSMVSHSQIDYSNLQPGDYVFQVRPIVNGEYGQLEERHFSISPPFWKTWWFILLCLAFVGFLVFVVFYKGILVYNRDVIRGIIRSVFYKFQHERTLSIKDLSDGSIRKLKIADITHIESERNNVVFILSNGESIKTRKTMKETEAWLDKIATNTFIRIHRSYLVNLHHVKGVKPGFVLLEKKNLSSGKNYTANLKTIRDYIAL